MLQLVHVPRFTPSQNLIVEVGVYCGQYDEDDQRFVEQYGKWPEMHLMKAKPAGRLFATLKENNSSETGKSGSHGRSGIVSQDARTALFSKFKMHVVVKKSPEVQRHIRNELTSCSSRFRPKVAPDPGRLLCTAVLTDQMSLLS